MEGLSAHPAFHQLALLREDADLAFHLVDVHANMVHGWPLLSAALTAWMLLWGSVCHHVEREAGRFIQSMLLSGDREVLEWRPRCNHCRCMVVRFSRLFRFVHSGSHLPAAAPCCAQTR